MIKPPTVPRCLSLPPSLFFAVAVLRVPPRPPRIIVFSFAGLQRKAHTIIIVLGLVAFAASWQAVSNYVGSLETVRSLELELTEVRRADTDSAQLDVRFRLHNRSELPVHLNSYFFDLYLNGNRIGGSSSTWRDNDPDADQSLYSRASTIEQTLAPQESLDMGFPLYIFELEQIMAASKGSGWSVEVGLRLIHPYAHDERLLRMQATLQEPEQ